MSLLATCRSDLNKVAFLVERKLAVRDLINHSRNLVSLLRVWN